MFVRTVILGVFFRLNIEFSFVPNDSGHRKLKQTLRVSFAVHLEHLESSGVDPVAGVRENVRHKTQETPQPRQL